MTGPRGAETGAAQAGAAQTSGANRVAAERAPAPLGAGAGYVIGVDGGGTRSTIVVAGRDGREAVRSAGPAGIVEPHDPTASAATLVELVRRTAADAGLELPASALCAGLAGVGDATLREAVREGVAASGVADRVEIATDGQIALDGALGADAGVLLIAGTGSVAYGRGGDGRVERCGGWGMVVGDEGSGYAIARAGLQAGLQAEDRRGPPSRLLEVLMAAIGIVEPREIPSWVGRTGKGGVAALAPRVVRLAEEGDEVARSVVDRAADDLAAHARTLLDLLGPWTPPVPVVFHGGLLSEPAFADRVEARLAGCPIPATRRRPAADAVTGAVRRALSL